MNGTTQQERYEKGLNFFGAIVRSLSHQLTNVLAIITELTGLMEDFLISNEPGTPLDPAKLRNAIDRIARQLERGNGYIRQLNRFGHSVDHPKTTMEAGEILERVMGYCERFATLKKMTLTHSRPEADIPMEGSPFDLQHLLYRCIDTALSASSEGAELAVTLEAADGGARFTLSGQEVADAGGEVSSRLTLARQLVEAAGGSLDSATDPGRQLRLVVSLPATLHPLSAGTDGRA